MFNRKTATTLVTTALAAALAVLAVGQNAHAATLPISSCGQTVTQSAVLTQDLDCTGTSGIVVGAPGITIDLKGHVLKGDRLAGHYGIYDVYDDATIKNGVVRNFDIGVFVVGPADRLTVSNVVVTGNFQNGVYVVGDSVKIVSSTAAGNGGRGIYVEGDSASVRSSTAAGNGANGIWLAGAAPSVKSSRAVGNATMGISLDGDSAKVTSTTANGNGLTGISVQGALGSVKSSTASGNAYQGINVSGDAAVLTSNRAEANGFAGGVSDGNGMGIYAGAATVGTKNIARGNDDPAACTPSSLCPAVDSKAEGTPITSCGQTVTTNAVLAQDLACPATGMYVDASGITIDLNGHTLKGTNNGSWGISDLSGFDDVTIKNGVVRNFTEGVRAQSSADGITVSNVVVSGNANAGVYIVGPSAKIVSSTAAGNGQTGIYVEGDSASVTSSTAARNGADGISLKGAAATVKSSNAVANNLSGMRLVGDSASVASSTVSGNAVYGLFVVGTSAAVKSTTASGNASHGIAVLGDAATLGGNRAYGNGLPGGVSDGFGTGIFASNFTTAPVGTNIVSGNDDAGECNPSALC
jgi:hypothetical protein